jgi:hypothetical protein
MSSSSSTILSLNNVSVVSGVVNNTLVVDLPKSATRVLHKFKSYGSYVEVQNILDGVTFGSPQCFKVSHSSGITANDVFKVLCIPIEETQLKSY